MDSNITLSQRARRSLHYFTDTLRPYLMVVSCFLLLCLLKDSRVQWVPQLCAGPSIGCLNLGHESVTLCPEDLSESANLLACPDHRCELASQPHIVLENIRNSTLIRYPEVNTERRMNTDLTTAAQSARSSYIRIWFRLSFFLLVHRQLGW